MTLQRLALLLRKRIEGNGPDAFSLLTRLPYSPISPSGAQSRVESQKEAHSKFNPLYPSPPATVGGRSLVSSKSRSPASSAHHIGRSISTLAKLETWPRKEGLNQTKTRAQDIPMQHTHARIRQVFVPQVRRMPPDTKFITNAQRFFAEVRKEHKKMPQNMGLQAQDALLKVFTISTPSVPPSCSTPSSFKRMCFFHQVLVRMYVSDWALHWAWVSWSWMGELGSNICVCVQSSRLAQTSLCSSSSTRQECFSKTMLWYDEPLFTTSPNSTMLFLLAGGLPRHSTRRLRHLCVL